MLIDGSDGGDGLRALAVLAETLGPELHPPARETLQLVGIGHGDDARLAFERSRRHQGRPERDGNLAGGNITRPDRRVHGSRALADGADIEAEYCGWQQPDIGQGRIASAYAGVMLEKGAALRFEQIAQGILRPVPAWLGEADDMVSDGQPANP